MKLKTTMKNYFLLILLTLLFSCNKKNPLNHKESIADTYYKKAKEKDQDSAFYYFNLAKNSFLEKFDSVGVGKSLVNMAIIQHNNGDYYGSIETSLEANKFLKQIQDSITKSTLASSYNNMGICSSYLYDFDNSVKFYKQAINYTNVPENKYTYHNNLGNVLTTLKKYDEAKINLKYALNTKDNVAYARALNNLARAKFNENPDYNALPELYEALKIRLEKNNLYEENSSYATLSNYFLKKDSNKALYFAKKMLEVSTKNNSKEDQLQALQKIINLDNKNYSKYFVRFQTLNDSLQISKNKAKNQFAVIRYDVEQKNAQNQILKAQSFKQVAGIASLVIALISVFFWNERRKKHIRKEKEKEKELEVKNTELRYSKKVHDKVANKVYHVMSEVENTEYMNKEVLLYKLDGIYQISRDISYEKNDVALEHNFSQHLSQMLKSYSSETIKVPIIGNEESLWEDISDNSKVEIFYILQELMTNMKKHSKADKVLLDFSRENEQINISYSDNGVGISEFSPKNGLQNTESRINSIAGTINFDTKTENGLKITLSFPAKN